MKPPRIGLAALLLLCAGPLSGAVVIWTGTTDNTWGTAANWGGTVPTSADVATFSNTVSNTTPTLASDTTYTLQGIDITGGTASITITGGNSNTAFFVGSSGIAHNNSVWNWGFSSNGTISAAETSGTLLLSGSGTGGSINSRIVDNGTTGVTKTGTGTWRLTFGANSYTGATKILGGTLVVQNLANGGATSWIGAATSAAENLILDGGTLSMNNNSNISTDRLFSVGLGGATIAAESSGGWAVNFTNTGALGFNSQSGARTLTLRATHVAGANSLASVIGDNGGATSLSKTGVGTWIISGANTYTGATTVDAGTLRLGGSNVLSNSTAVNVSSGATLDMNGNSDTVASLDGAGNVTLGSGTLTVAANSTTHTFSGVASGAGGLTKSGTSAWNLTGANTYTGATTVTGGNLTITSVANGGTASNLGAASTAASNLVLNGGTLRYTGTGHSTDRLFSVGASEGAIVAAGSGVLNFTNTGAIGFNGQTGARTLYLLGTGNGSLAPIWGDNGGANTLYKGESGTWTLSGANTYTGATTVDAGTLRLGASNVLSNSTAVSVSSGATLDLNGNNDTIGSLAGAGNVTLGSGRLTIGAANTSTTFSGVASGTGGLTKTGSGTLTLSGANTYTGETFIFGGALSVNSLANGGSNSAIGAAPNGAGYLVFANNGALTYTGAAASTDRLFAMGSGGATINASGTGALQFTNTGALTGNGQTDARTLTLGGTNADGNTFNPIIGDFTGATSVTKTGAGVWNLVGANTYTGATTINGGLLYASSLADGGSASHLGSASSAASNLVLNGGTLVYTGGAVSTDRLFSVGTGNGGINASGSGALTFTNAGAMGFVGSGARTFSLSGSGNASLAAVIGDNGGATSVSMSGPGIWALTGANTYTGGTTISGGTLIVGNGSTSGSIAGNVSLSGGHLRFNRSNDVSFSGAISGTGNLEKAGAGVLTLTGNNTLTGTTFITAGTIRAGANESLGAQANGHYLQLNSGTIFDLNGFTQTINGVQGPGSVQLGSGTLTVGNSTGANYDLYSPGVISGTGGLIKTGTNTQYLSGANTYTGGTTVNAGYLEVYGTLASTGAVSTSGNGVINLRSTQTIGALSGTGGYLWSPGGNLTIDQSTDTTYAGIIQGGGWTKTGSGTLTLSGNNTFSYLYINGGTIAATTLSAGGSSSVSSGGVHLNGGTLKYVGSGQTTSYGFLYLFTAGSTIDASGTGALALTYGGDIAMGNSGARILTLTGSNTGNNVFGYRLYDSGGATSLTKSGAGTWVLTQNNSYTGTTLVGAGMLKSGANNVLPDASAISVTSGATLDLNGYTDTIGSIAGAGSVALGAGALTAGGSNASTTFSGAISGTGAFTKAGAGTLTLSGTNTFTGTTTITAGTLAVTGTLASASVSVASGATLTGPANLNDLSLSGTYAPGSSPALVSLDSLVMTSTGILQMEIGGAARGTEYDALDIAGAFTADGTLTVTFINAFAPTGPATFNLFDFGSLAGTFDTLNLPTLGAGYSWDTSALYSAGELSIATAIPEPSTYAALVGLMALGLVFWRRRHEVRN